MAFSSLRAVAGPEAAGGGARTPPTSLKYRDFLTVALVVPESVGFPDNWIYIHSPEVEVGRIQNFGSWSPYLVKEGKTCLGLEFFVNVGDDTWNRSDEDLLAQAKRELDHLGLVKPEQVERGFVVRMPKAYPFYDAEPTSATSTSCGAGWRRTPRTCTRSAATACSATTTRTTRCSRRS